MAEAFVDDKKAKFKFVFSHHLTPCGLLCLREIEKPGVNTKNVLLISRSDGTNLMDEYIFWVFMNFYDRVKWLRSDILQGAL